MKALLALSVLVAGCVAESWRIFPPEPVREVRADVPIYRQHRLPNGLTLIHHETGQLPQVVVQLVLRVGAAAVPEKQAGLLWLWLSTLGEEDEEEQRALDRLGDVPRAVLEPTQSTLSMTVEKSSGGAALANLAKMIRSPQMAQQTWERRRARQVVLLRADQADPHVVADQVLRKALYGARHPMAQSTYGTVDSVASLTAAELAAFHKTYVGPQNLAVIIVGSVNEAEALSWVDASFSDWNAVVQAPPPLPPAQPLPQRHVFFVPQPGLGQSIITVGGQAPPAGHLDEVPLFIAGGLLSSRIQEYLRGRDNVSYGARFRVRSSQNTGHFSISAAVEVDATASSLEEMMSQSFMLAVNGFPPRAMPYLRVTAIWRLTSIFDTLSGTASAAGELYGLGRPIDYPQTLLKTIPQLTHGEVYEAARRYLDRDRFQIVVLGDVAVSSKVARLKLGPLSIERPR